MARFYGRSKTGYFRGSYFFTPGDSIDLPKEHLHDFAYAIHSDVSRFETSINDRICAITTVLNTETPLKSSLKGQKGPELSWLEFTKTNVAKPESGHFWERRAVTKIKRGKNILQIEFDRAGLGSVDGMNFKKVQAFMKGTHKSFCLRG